MNRRTDRLMNWKEKLGANPNVANNLINAGVSMGEGGTIRRGDVVERCNAAVPSTGRIAQGKDFYFKQRCCRGFLKRIKESIFVY